MFVRAPIFTQAPVSTAKQVSGKLSALTPSANAARPCSSELAKVTQNLSLCVWDFDLVNSIAEISTHGGRRWKGRQHPISRPIDLRSVPGHRAALPLAPAYGFEVEANSLVNDLELVCEVTRIYLPRHPSCSFASNKASPRSRSLLDVDNSSLVST